MNLTHRPVLLKGMKSRKRKSFAVADDEAFRAWVQRQPSCLSHLFSEYVDGEGRCIAAHVRRASASGIGFKGMLSCVPMTDAEHQLQHKKGEAACLAYFLGGTWTTEDAKRWFDIHAAKYRDRWLEEREQ